MSTSGLSTYLNDDFRFRLNSESPIHRIDFSECDERFLQQTSDDVERLGPHERDSAGDLQRLTSGRSLL